MPDTQPRWFAGRKVTACRECPDCLMYGQFPFTCRHMRDRDRDARCKHGGVRHDCPLPIYEEETIVGVSPARLRQLLDREKALKALITSPELGDIMRRTNAGAYTGEWACMICGYMSWDEDAIHHRSDCVLAAAIEAAQEEDEA